MVRKPFRWFTVWLALCVLAASFPTAGLTVGETEPFADGFDLKAAIEDAPSGSTIDLTEDVFLKAQTSDAAPWRIPKDITINGNNHVIKTEDSGIILEGDVTFKDVTLALVSAEGRNAIIANGYDLTLENVKTGNLGRSINIFCGGLVKGADDSYDVPAPDPDPQMTLTIRGTTNLQGDSINVFGSANIFAGTLSVGDFSGGGVDAASSSFPGDVTINIEGSAGGDALGTIYAGGAQQRRPVGADAGKETVPDPDKYTVSGTVSISVKGTKIPDIDGAGSDRTNVIYNGDGTPAPKVFANISSLSVQSGELELIDGMEADSSFRDERAVSVADGAKLDVQGMAAASVDKFEGGGFLILGQSQTFQITGSVTGKTKVAIEAINFDGTKSTVQPKEGQIYIQAKQSVDGDFVLLPDETEPNMELVRDSSGNWTASVSSSGGDENLIASFQFIDKKVSVIEGEEAELKIEAHRENNYYEYLDFQRLTITIDGGKPLSVSEDADGYLEYRDTLDEYTAYVNDNILCITTSVKGTHTISVTLPRDATVGGKVLSDTATLTVTDSSGTLPDPEPTAIPVPTEKTGLTWTGAEQTGVEEGIGYTLTGHRAADVGDYKAIATLEPDYQWDDGSTTPKTISWSIAKAAAPAAPTSLGASTPTGGGASDGKITGTTSEMEYASSPDFTGAQDCGDTETTGLSAGTYYVRYKETATHEAGKTATITVPAFGAPTVTGISVSSAGHKITYQVNDPLDVTGLTIKAAYSNQTEQEVEVTENMISGFDSSQAAESQTLTITYEGKTTTYTIKITAPEPNPEPEPDPDPEPGPEPNPDPEPPEKMYQVTVNNLGAGGSGGGSYAEGAAVVIRAGSKNGLTFSSWNSTGVTLASPSQAETSFVMPGNDVTLLAIWKQNDGTAPPSHTHTWAASWTSDKTHHWHNCTASGCPLTSDSLKDGYAVHTAGNWVVDRPAASSQSGERHRSCTVCGYEMERETLPATGGGSGGNSGSSSESSSSGSSNSTTVKNPDGSTTSTNTNPSTGTVTETTRRPDGSKLVVETKKDGTVSSTETAKDGSTVKNVERPDGSWETNVKRADGLTASVQGDRNSAKANVQLPSDAVQESQKNGVPIALPLPALPGADASVTIHTGSAKPTRVEIPVQGNVNTTVAYLVNGDGSETLVKTAALDGGQMTLSVPNGAVVQFRENEKTFYDAQSHWARDAIDFVTARELFAGKTSTAFAPDMSMSRAMLMTVLARLDGVETAEGSAYQTGMTWAISQGISDGRNPESLLTREQLVTMLYRYAGAPAATNQELHFSDAGKVSGYAREAMLWAEENSILGGYADGSVVPGGNATRAQTAAILTRYLHYLNNQ